MKSSLPMSDNDRLSIAQDHLSKCRYRESLDIFKELLTRHNNPRLLHLAGTAALQEGIYPEAISLFKSSLEIDPSQADTHSHLGIVYWNLKDYANAEKCYREALKANDRYVEAYNNLCMVMQDGFKKPDEALTLIDRAIEIRPDYADAYNNRGNVLQGLNRFSEALVSYDRSISLKPDSASAHNNRGNALRKLDRFSEALSAYQKAIELKPDYAEAFCNMGCTLADLGQVEDARRFYMATLTMDPSFAKAHYNLGSLENASGNYDLAFNCYDKAISLDASFADAYWNKSLLKLLLGDYQEGFKLYEWGWENRIRGKRRPFKQPAWTGKESIHGKRLLIHQEQGIGDCIHYARYIKNAVDMGATVIMEAVAPLIPFLKSIQSPCQFVPLGEPLPDFDCYIPLMSLPLAFETTLENMPTSGPYLFSEKSRSDLWIDRLGPKSKPRVGIVWSGSTLHKNDRNRSMGLKELLPLLALPLDFHCLQKEIRTEDSDCLPALPMIHVHHHEICDFADTAALINAMDIIISVDTSVAHAAGAMGKATWILLPSAPDWRWLIDRDDSPWYSSVKLFRQNHSGDWSSVIQKVRTALLEQFLSKEIDPAKQE